MFRFQGVAGSSFQELYRLDDGYHSDSNSEQKVNYESFSWTGNDVSKQAYIEK
jgi:hypothetical protein